MLAAKCKTRLELKVGGALTLNTLRCTYLVCRPFHGLLYSKIKGQVSRAAETGSPLALTPDVPRVIAGCARMCNTAVPALPCAIHQAGLLRLPSPNSNLPILVHPRLAWQAEEAAKAAGFKYTAIMQPGLLDRGDLMRGLEKALLKVVSSVPVAQVAHAMIGDAEAYHAAAAAGGSGGAGEVPSGARVYSMKEIQQYKPAAAAS